MGRICDFYSESDIRSVCVDLLQDLPRADKSGFFKKDGIKYGTSYAWSKVLAISQPTIISRLKQLQTEGVKGKDLGGRIFDFFSESDVLSACADLLQDLPRADEASFLEKDGIKYGIIEAWLKVLPVSKGRITARLKNSQAKSIKGKTQQGIIRNFYSEINVRIACSDIIDPYDHPPFNYLKAS